MTTVRALFPGQGSQAVGMGKRLAIPLMRRMIFDQVDNALDEPCPGSCLRDRKKNSS